ncbi:MAG: YceI family protein [Methanococcaceae archaeon]
MKTMIYFIALILFPFFIFATEHNIDKGRKNLVKFISDAKIESFEGTTDKIDGYLVFDGNDILSKSSLYFEVDLRTLDTGIGLRNRHMREEYLETDKYPLTTFKGKIIKADKISEGNFKVLAEGDLTIHGVTKKVQTIGQISNIGNGFHITSKFEVRLPDYNIEVPTMMFLKISEIIKLDLDFFTKQVK